MTLENLLSREQSRANIDQVIEIVLQKPELFEELWSLILKNENPVSRRAAWAVDILTETNNTFLKHKHLETLVNLLTQYNHDGLKRHSLRILERNNIKESTLGMLMSCCFNFLENPKESVAVKMFSLKILNKMAIYEPALRRELIDIIEMQMIESTPGFKSIGRKVIHSLQKTESILQNR